MSQFMKPTFGNKDRIGSPVNSVKNLQRKINRQARAAAMAKQWEISQ